MKEKLSSSFSDIPSSDIANSCTKCDNLSTLIGNMKQKIKVCYQWEKLQLLTLVLESCSKRKAAKEFQASRNLAAKAKQLKSKLGILAIHRSQIQTVIPNNIEEKIVSFYRSDTVTRVCPGKNDSVSVETDGVKEYIQKCLMLGDLK